MRIGLLVGLVAMLPGSGGPGPAAGAGGAAEVVAAGCRVRSAPGAPGRPHASLGRGAARPEVTVRLTDRLRYEPGVITVKAGTTVVWENASVLVHTVTDDPARATVEGSTSLPDGADPFDSGLMNPGAAYRHTFTVPGTYRYFCIPHEGAKMWGTVVVE